MKPLEGSPKDPQKLCHLSAENRIPIPHIAQKRRMGMSSGVLTIFISPTITPFETHATSASRIRK